MGIKLRLTVLNFLQFFAWGAWLLSAGSYMYVSLNFSGIQIGAAYATMGFASVFMPALMGIVADKWISAEKILGASHLILFGLLIALAKATDFNSFYPLIFLVSMFFMPTIGLNRSISFGTLESRQMDIIKVFPPIRVWGTVGFILAAWLVDFLEIGITPNQFYVSAGASFILGVYAFTLPRVGIQESSEKKTFVESLGLNAFALFKKKKIAIFLIFSMLLGCVLQISNMWGDGFLQDFRGEYPDSFVVKHSLVFISLSMVSEALFILAIPFFLKKFGIKKVMLLSMLAWVLRFAFFGIGDPGSGFIFLTLSMIIYGMAFDFFNISGSMFMAKESSPSIRSSAQGLFMLMTNGLGAIIGAYGSGYIVDLYTGADGMKDWSTIWYIFALYALVVTIAFALVFKYKHDPEELGAVKH
ncbi:MAG: nucleoside permease [Crocinitomicaceae bacterium]|nr:nucleoside permease [Crocinitomicaceae bacterium]MDC0098705.1 nucleoside permease [Crocinitomicaceae bacterium]